MTFRACRGLQPRHGEVWTDKLATLEKCQPEVEKEYRCFFVTTTCRKWLPLLQHEETKEICYRFLEQSCEKHSVDIMAYAIIPDHLHLIIYFDEANKLTDFMREFKQLAAFHILKWLRANKPNFLKQLEINQKGQRYKVWKDRFDDIHI